MTLSTWLSSLFQNKQVDGISLKHSEPGWMTVTQIGGMVGHTAYEVNYYLGFHKYQYREPKGYWRLTPLGKEHGEEYIFEAVNKHQEIRIRWRSSVVYASGLNKEAVLEPRFPDLLVRA